MKPLLQPLADLGRPSDCVNLTSKTQRKAVLALEQVKAMLQITHSIFAVTCHQTCVCLNVLLLSEFEGLSSEVASMVFANDPACSHLDFSDVLMPECTDEGRIIGS